MTTLDPYEYNECCTLADYLDTLQRQRKILRYTHIPNETWTKSWSQKIKNKKQGVRKGFPDYVIVCHYRLVFIEMKRKKGGEIKPEQQEWIDDLQKLGFTAVICRGFDEAKIVIDANL